MKKIKVTITDGTVSWNETYDITDNVDGITYIGNMLNNFNSSLRPNERKRTLVCIEEIGNGTEKHKWTKSSGATIQGTHGMYDKYICKVCGVTGKRYGLSSEIKRDGKYTAKCYETCTSTLEHLKKKVLEYRF